VPLLAAADEQQLRETFLAARVREYPSGAEIIRQNDYTNDFLIVASGRVELRRRPEQAASEVKIAELTAGNFFGEMSLISGRRRTATAVAQGPTRIIEIPRKSILKLLGNAPKAKNLVDQAFMLRAFGGYRCDERAVRPADLRRGGGLLAPRRSGESAAGLAWPGVPGARGRDDPLLLIDRR